MKVTVYIPTRNRLPLLRRAMDSVLAQSYPDIELIIVDDASEDGTRDFLQSFSHLRGRVKTQFFQTCQGACRARNAAVAAASGDFVTGLDDDDCFASSQRIAGLVSGWEQVRGPVAGLFDSVQVLRREGPTQRHTQSRISYSQLRHRNEVSNQVFAPKQHFLDVGGFDEQMPAWQDWDLWLRMARRFGDFISLNSASYWIDESAAADRISQSHEAVLRAAMRRLGEKLAPMSRAETASHVMALHDYPQVRPRVAECLTLLAAGRWRGFLRSFLHLIR